MSRKPQRKDTRTQGGLDNQELDAPICAKSRSPRKRSRPQQSPQTLTLSRLAEAPDDSPELVLGPQPHGRPRLSQQQRKKSNAQRCRTLMQPVYLLSMCSATSGDRTRWLATTRSDCFWGRSGVAKSAAVRRKLRITGSVAVLFVQRSCRGMRMREDDMSSLEQISSLLPALDSCVSSGEVTTSLVALGHRISTRIPPPARSTPFDVFVHLSPRPQ